MTDIAEVQTDPNRQQAVVVSLRRPRYARLRVSESIISCHDISRPKSISDSPPQGSTHRPSRLRQLCPTQGGTKR